MLRFRYFSTMIVSAALLASCAGGGGRVAPSVPPEKSAVGRQANPLASGGTVVFHAYNTSGTLLSWSAFRKLQENGHGSTGDNDALIDPATLQVKSMWPLQSSGGNPSLQLPSGPAALALAWPTSDGYSNLIINLPSTGGTFVFNLLAAQQVVSDLDKAQSARSWYTPSSAQVAVAANAHSLLAKAQTASTESQRGALGAQALDAAVHAETLLLAESGIQYAAAHHTSTGQPEWGVTFDNIDAGSLQTVFSLYGSDGWVRLVTDDTTPPSSYAAEIATAHQLGLHVVVQFLDSSYMPHLTEAQWESRVQTFVATLADVDEWEIGNEVNGNWLGTGVPQKLAYAASYVKGHTQAHVLLTLYWYLGSDDAAHSMFTWAAQNLSSAIRANVDDLGISLYPEEEPMGSAFERVMTTLHSQFPVQRLMVTECDYWTADGDKIWWWGSASDPYNTGRLAVAKLYQSAVYGYPYSGGGTFWWNYLEEALPQNALWRTLNSVHQAM